MGGKREGEMERERMEKMMSWGEKGFELDLELGVDLLFKAKEGREVCLCRKKKRQLNGMQ